VLGVEPDSRMAAVARAHGIRVEVATFEAWDPAGRRFDLVMSAQAWHWIDPAVGPKKAAALLSAGGSLAVFGNRGQLDPAVQTAMREVYAQHAPAMGKGTRSDHAAALAATGLVEAPELLRYAWDRRYSRDEWLDQMGTHSDHAILPPAQLAALMAAVAEVIDRFGGSIDYHYDTQLIIARKSAAPPR